MMQERLTSHPAPAGALKRVLNLNRIVTVDDERRSTSNASTLRLKLLPTAEPRRQKYFAPSVLQFKIGMTLVRP